MAKIDRLGWADGISLRAFGVHVGIRVNNGSILAPLMERTPPGSKISASQTVEHLYSISAFPADSQRRIRRFNIGYWNLVRFARSRSFDQLLDAFESHLQLTVAEFSPRRVFVHAGVVGWKRRAILIPGMTFSGKTTLVDHLLRAGATYYSDEYAVLDEKGRVHPYARPLGLRSINNQTKVRAEDLGAEVGSRPLPIALVVSTRFREGAKWRPRSLSPGKGVLELLANTVSARQQPEFALSVLPKALRSARIVKSARGEAREIVDSILGDVD